MQARIRGLVRAGVAVVVLAAAGGANAQLVPKEEVREEFVKATEPPVSLFAVGRVSKWIGLWTEDMEGIPEGMRYEGEERDGKPHGRGVLVFDDGGRFEGEYRDGRPHGYFVLTTTLGERGRLYAEAELRGDGKKHGHFVITYPGRSYEGGFRDGKRHGHFLVVRETADGEERVEGEFRDGVPVEGTVTIRAGGMVVRD